MKAARHRPFWHTLLFREEFLVLIVLLFFATGGLIDYWQASIEHGYLLPQFLKDYFGIFWLILFTGLFPFLMVLDASNFNWRLARLYLGLLLVGTSLWDFTYSLLSTGQLVSSQAGYFYLRGQNFGLTESQMYLWHIFRIFLGVILVLWHRHWRLKLID